MAAYGQGTFNFTDQLSATLGVRWIRDEKDYTSFLDGRGRVPVGTPPVLTPQPQSVSGEWENFSPRIGLEYRWTPDIMTYVSAAQGFKGGGFNDTLQTTCNAAALPGDPLFKCGLSEFNEENLVTYEAGLRSDWFGNRLRFNATYFSTTVPIRRVPRMLSDCERFCAGLRLFFVFRDHVAEIVDAVGGEGCR